MADIFTKSKRAELMSRVCGRGNKATELALVKLLRTHHITGWRRHRPILGSPDFVFPTYRLAVLVDGCFWHGCPKHATTPATNRGFWRKKLTRNKARDELVNQMLRQRGWMVLRIWQHELRRRNEGRVLLRIRRALAARIKNASGGQSRLKRA